MLEPPGLNVPQSSTTLETNLTADLAGPTEPLKLLTTDTVLKLEKPFYSLPLIPLLVVDS